MGVEKSRSYFFRLALGGDDPVHLAVDAAHNLCESEDVDPEDAARLAIVVEEIVTNLYEHGRNIEAGPVTFSLSRQANLVSIMLSDCGTAFDPRTRTTEPSLQFQRGGGAGLALARAWTTTMHYHSLRDRNIFELTMPLGGCPSKD